MNTYQAYLFDLGLEIKLRALKAKEERDESQVGTEQRSLHTGRLLAFNEVISMMQQSAEGLGIPLADLRLNDVDPDRDLM